MVSIFKNQDISNQEKVKTELKLIKIVTYTRVSTNDKGQNPEVQIAELRRYCLGRNWMIEEEIVDHGYSGGTDQRPGLKHLMSQVRAGEINIVVVTKLDRMARSLKHLISILDEFTSRSVLFVSIGDQIDLGTASGRLMLHIIAAFAEFERALIRDRTIAGLIFAKNNGKILGRPKTRPDELIISLRAEGLSYTQIQKRVGCTRSAIYRALKAISKTSTKEAFQSSQRQNLDFTNSG